MKLSETQRARLRSSHLHEERFDESQHQHHAFWWRVGLSAGMLGLLGIGLVAGLTSGHFQVSFAASGQPQPTVDAMAANGQPQSNPDVATAQRQNATERHHRKGQGQNQQPAQPNMNCTLIVPANPLSAQGLATPYQLVATNPADGPCHESNPDQSAFVQGAVLDPAAGNISVYNPLVIDKGTQPAAQPVVPTLPANAVVALWFGFNGNMLRLSGRGDGALAAGRCVNGRGDSIFGQVAYCNAPQFFATANQLIQAGMLTPPALGTANDGMTCPTVRDFSVVDQDQSDNVTTTYLVTANGQIAQNTAANAAALGNQAITNGSDNRLLAVALAGALGCTPWKAPDLADPGKLVPAQPLNELQAAMFQQAPIAQVPSGDPMVLVNGQPNLAKQNLYRAGVDQSRVQSVQQANADMKSYCQNLLQIAPARLQLDMQFTQGRASPVPAAATNLFTFLAQRFNFTWGANGLNCAGLLNQQSPITVQTNGNGVAVSATITLNGQGTGTGNGQPAPTATTPPGPGGTGTGTGQGNAPTCVFNGTAVQGCMGTATLNGQTCTVTYDAAMKQVAVTCQQP